MLKVGILGFGFMGKCHFNAYASIPDVKVVALCDIEPERATQAAAGNLDVGGGPNLTDVKIGRRFSVFKDAGADLVDICLPTFLHDPFTVRALKDGFHVMCEKPMALTPARCRKMIAARDATGRKLMIGQCIQFWPEWAYVKELAVSGKYGKPLSAAIRRLSATPTWAWDNWIVDEARSGGMILDLHVHDADFVGFVFGKPRAVLSTGIRNTCNPGSGVDHVFTQYLYDGGPAVSTEGFWAGDPGYPFSMTYLVKFEKATVMMGPDFKVFPAQGSPFTPTVPAGDGYANEIRYFLDCILQNQPVAKGRPEDAMAAIEMVLAEKKSLLSGRIVRF